MNEKITVYSLNRISDTVCPRSSDPFYIVTYYVKRVTASWTYSISLTYCHYSYSPKNRLNAPKFLVYYCSQDYTEAVDQ